MPSPIGTPYDVEPSDASVASADSAIVDATAVNEVDVVAGDGTAAVIGGPVVEEASTVVELSDAIVGDADVGDADVGDVELSDADVIDAGTELAAPLVWSGAWTSLAHPVAISSSAMINAHLGDVSPTVQQRPVVGVFCLTICDRSPRASAMGERLRSVSQMIEMFEVPPQAEEFCALRVAAGLSPKDETAAAIALQRSLYAVCLRDEQRLVGMGRVVGDGLHVQVTDIAVHPDYQGKGLSRTIMESIMEYIATLPTGTGVSLFADVDWLYQKFGFSVPTKSTGMYLTTWPATVG